MQQLVKHVSRRRTVQQQLTGQLEGEVGLKLAGGAVVVGERAGALTSRA